MSTTITRVKDVEIITLNTTFFGYDDVFEVIIHVAKGTICDSFIKINGKVVIPNKIFSDDRYILFKVLERELSSELTNFEAWFSPLKKEVM